MGSPRAYYETNRETIKAATKRNRRLDREVSHAQRLFSKNVWSHARERAKKFGRDFSVMREDYPIPLVCPVLGIPLDWSDRNHTPSIDRIDTTKGYIKGNVVIVSNKVNVAKSDLTIVEIIKMAEFYKELV